MNRFVTNEPEFNILPKFLKAGDWAIDVGANVGHYTKRFSDLVGPSGRVIAFEPVPTTFALLSANVQLFANSNVTLINAALSDETALKGMSTPAFPTGLTNYFEAHLVQVDEGALNVLTLPLDAFDIRQKIVLVKIDTEGHEVPVLRGMQKLLMSQRPYLIIEIGTDSEIIVANLRELGYTHEKFPGSPNIVFRPVVIPSHDASLPTT